MTIGEKIKNIRKMNHLTQKQLGEMSGLATGTIQQYELGKRQPRIDQLRKIAFALNLNLNDFIDDWSQYSVQEYLEDWNSNEKHFLKPNNNPFNLPSYNASLYGHIEVDIITESRKLNMQGKEKALEYLKLLSKVAEFQLTQDDTILPDE